MPVYFDNNSATQLDSRVLEVMLPYLQHIYGNASSLHRYGRLVRSGIEQAREQLAQAVNAHPDQIIFTSGGTEANNLVVKGVAASARKVGSIAISSVEHASLREPAFQMKKQGWQVEEVAVNADGTISTDDLKQRITEETRLFSLLAANNETGVIQPLPAVAEILAQTSTVFHTDASQLLGKQKVDFAACGAQLMTLSAHKAHGPIGAGALVADRGVVLQPQMFGGDHERGLRAGTENIAAIVGFGKAAELAASELSQRTEHMMRLRIRLEAGLKQMSEVRIFAEEAERLPNTVQFGVEGCHGETLLLQLDRLGFAVSSGSACHSQVHKPSHVLVAMGVPDDLALTAIRVSLSQYSNEAEVDKFLAAFAQMLNEFRQTPVRAVNAN